jgi:hypothetical protein
MARIRTYKPSFFRSEDVAALTFRARLTWLGLWPHCDDEGRMKDNAKLIKGDVWPLDDVSLEDVEEDLAQLAAEGRIVRYEVDGRRYLAVTNWLEHQRIQKPTPSKIPPPPGSGSTPGGVEDRSGSATGGKGREEEGKGGEGERASAPPPPPDSRPRCQRHAHLADDDPGPNCIGCRDARLAVERGRNPPTEIPPWCGECSEGSRQLELADRQLARCPRCHPLRSVS